MDNEIKGFWHKYQKADSFDKKEMIKTLPLMRNIARLKKMDDEVFEYVIIGIFQDYIEDAIDAIADKPQRSLLQIIGRQG